MECFVHIFDNCTQNSSAVLPIIEHLLNIVKEEYPEVIMPDANIMQSRSAVLSYPPYGARETLENAGHVSPRIWEVTNKRFGGGAGKCEICLYRA